MDKKQVGTILNMEEKERIKAANKLDIKDLCFIHTTIKATEESICEKNLKGLLNIR